MREQTDHYARQGYVALAVDLYCGKTAQTMEQAHVLRVNIPSS